MPEEWKTIRGYEGLYKISSLGRVCTFSGIIKKQSGTLGPRSRYKYVTLYKSNVGAKVQVHRLVAEHFIPNPFGYPYVLHKRNDRSDNTKTNLRWGTQQHNIADAIKDGTYRKPPIYRGIEQWNAKLDPAKVRKIRKIKQSSVWISQEALATQFGISRGTLRAVLSGKAWRHIK